MDDKPWITDEVKTLDRQRKREFVRHHKSSKWHFLNDKYMKLIKKSKVSYANKMVNDLKSSNPSHWYSKVKRMSSINRTLDNNVSMGNFLS